MTTPKQPLSHVTAEGEPQMVDVGGKPATARRALAQGELLCTRRIMDLLRDRRSPKGDVYSTAKLAGILAAKRTAELIPLCHSLALDHVEVTFSVDAARQAILVRCEVRTTARTGVEMEALTGASVALLTLYDMLKAADKGMELGRIRLLEKDGGRSGPYRAE